MNEKETAEFEVLQQAITMVRRETGIQIQIQKTEVPVNQGWHADALLTIGPNETEVLAETKIHATRKNIGAIIDQVQRLPGNPMLVADYVNPKMAEILKRERIQYIDTVGNAFINVDPIYICLLYTSPSPRDGATSRMPSSA